MKFSDKAVKMWSTWFYVGNCPAAPGSAASVVGALLAIALIDKVILYILVTAVVTWIGFMVSGPMEDLVKIKDPSCVVIDEVAGILIAFFLLPISWPIVITTFFLFRAFDMFKIYPVSEFEKFPKGIGIMTDDLVAGVYTNITMHLAIRLAGIV